MKRFLSFFSILLIFSTYGCLQKGCEETDAPEINFGLLFGGSILIVTIEGDNEVDITNQYVDSDFQISCNKMYCNGTMKGPFPSQFKVNEDGSLYKQTIGSYSFRMDNTKDYMRIFLYLQDKEIGTYNIYYDALKAFNSETAYVHFTIRMRLNDTYLSTESVVAVIS